MNNNEILKAAQSDKGIANEYETHVFKTANIVAMCVSLAIGFGLILLEYFLKGAFEVGYAVILMWTIFVHHFVEIIKTKRTSAIVCGVFTLIMAIVSTVLYIVMW